MIYSQNSQFLNYFSSNLDLSNEKLKSITKGH